MVASFVYAPPPTSYNSIVPRWPTRKKVGERLEKIATTCRRDPIDIHLMKVLQVITTLFHIGELGQGQKKSDKAGKSCYNLWGNLYRVT